MNAMCNIYIHTDFNPHVIHLDNSHVNLSKYLSICYSSFLSHSLLFR